MSSLWWYVARSGGIVALTLSGMAVLLGLFMTTRVLEGRPSPKWLLAVHRYVGALTVVFTAVHIGGLVADSYVEFGLTDILVPLASDWKPVPVAFGVVGLYLLVAIEISSLVMKRIPRRWWRLIHASSFVLFWVGLVHGATAGTDAGATAYQVVMALSILLVLFFTLFRVLAGRGRRNPMARPRSTTVNA